MSQAKVEIVMGAFKFSGEGSEEWLAAQMDKVFTQSEKIKKLADDLDDKKKDSDTNGGGGDIGEGGRGDVALAKYLRDLKATDKPSRKYLATAAWLIKVKGQDTFTSKEVASVLRKNHQGRLSNAASFHKANVASGHLNQKGTGYYVTPEGYKELGIE